MDQYNGFINESDKLGDLVALNLGRMAQKQIGHFAAAV